MCGLIAGLVEHQHTLRALGMTSARDRWSVGVIVAVLITLIGGIVFLSELLRIGPF